jgi:hypothetical protein
MKAVCSSDTIVLATCSQEVTTQKANTNIFTAVRTSNATHLMVQCFSRNFDCGPDGPNYGTQMFIFSKV